MAVARMYEKEIKNVNGKELRFTFVLENGGAILVAYNGSETNVAIPSTVNGYNVTKIGKRAFQNATTITNLTIPGSVIYIDDYGLQTKTEGHTTFTFLGFTPPLLGENVFLVDTATIEIQVPSGMSEDWKTWDNNWKLYADYIVGEGYTLTFNVEPYIYNDDYYFYSLDSGSTWNAIDSAAMTVENVSKIRFKDTSINYGMNIGTSSGGSDIASVIYSETEDIVVTADATWYFTFFGGGSGA